MNTETLIKAMVRSFFIIVVGIVTGNYVMCLLFSPDAVIPVKQFGEILLCGVLSDLPFVVFYSRHELSKKQMLIRHAIHGVVLLAVLIALARVWNWIDFTSLFEVTLYLLIIAIVYIAVYVASYMADKKTANELNESLKEHYPK